MKNEKLLGEKIMKGVRLAVKKLIIVSQQNDDYLVISKNGKVIRIKARDLKTT